MHIAYPGRSTTSTLDSVRCAEPRLTRCVASWKLLAVVTAPSTVLWPRELNCGASFGNRVLKRPTLWGICGVLVTGSHYSRIWYGQSILRPLVLAIGSSQREGRMHATAVRGQCC